MTDATVKMGLIVDPGNTCATDSPEGGDQSASLVPLSRAGFVFERVGSSEIVEVTGTDDVRLKCGKSEIILCADGRIILRGTELILESQGQLKLNGAYVNIN